MGDKRSLSAVRQDGRALEYVRNQTEEICLAAVKQDGVALMFVKDLKGFKAYLGSISEELPLLIGRNEELDALIEGVFRNV